MTKKRNPTINELVELDHRNFPVYSKSFVDSVWNEFDLEAVLEVLLDARTSFRPHKPLLFTVLGTWVVAPHKTQERRTLILAIVSAFLAKVEKHILNQPPEKRFHHDLAARFGRVGPQFIEQIYYPIGGIAALHVHIPKEGREKYMRREYGKKLESLIQVIRIMHHEHETKRDMSLYQPASQKRCFDCLKKFNLQIKPTADSEGKLSKVYLEHKSLEIAFGEYQYVAVLAYAATLVQISETSTLLDRFYGRRNKLSLKDRRRALKEWLRISSYLFQDVIEPMGKSKLLPPSHLKNLRYTPKAVSAPAFEPWEADIIEKMMNKDHKSQA